MSAQLSGMSFASYQNANALSTSDHKGLQELAAKCQGTAGELLSSLKTLKAKNPDSRWSSFRVALSSICRQEDIQALEESLNTYRSELILELAVLEKYCVYFVGENPWTNKIQREKFQDAQPFG